MALKTRPIGMIVSSGVYFSLLLSLNGAPALGRNSDAELSRTLIGTWEVKPDRKFYPFNRSFLSFKGDGKFKWIAIADSLGGRQEHEGKWQVRDGKLIRETRIVSQVIPHFGYMPAGHQNISLLGDTGGSNQRRCGSLRSRLGLP